MSANSLATSGSFDKFVLKRSSESLLNLLREDSVAIEGGGFYLKYEPNEVLGRYVGTHLENPLRGSSSNGMS